MTSKENIRFLKETCYFLAWLIIAILIVNLIHYNLFTQKKQLYRNELEFQEMIEKNGGYVSYIYFGSSHTKDGANPHFLNDSFNMATGGEGTHILSYYRLRKIVELDRDRVGSIIVEIDPQVFNDRTYPVPFYIENLWYWGRLIFYEDIKDIVSLSYLDYLIQSKLYFMNGAKDITILFNPGKISDTYHGWAGNKLNFSEYPDKREYAKQYFKATFQNNHSELNEIGEEYFIKIIRLAKKNGIKIIFIKYPISRDYLRVINESGFDQEEYYKNLFSVIEKEGVDYSFFDYQDLILDDSYFGDPGHLNIGGSEILTAKLKTDLERDEKE